MAERRRYSKTQKAEAVGLAVMEGSKAAHERTGIPRQTIDYWLTSPEFGLLRQKSRDEVAEQMWAVIQMGVVEIAKGIRGEAPLRDKVVAVGVLYDKHALLTGMATARTESRDLTGTLSDADIIDALREAERAATAERTAAPSPGEAEG